MRYTLPALSVAAITAAASAQTWNFDAPVFTVGEFTPLTDRAANIPGPMGPMTATFATIDFGLMDIIDSSMFQPNSLMQGQFLAAGAGGPGPNGQLTLLTITFSQPVTSIDFDFALNAYAPGYNMFFLPDPNFNPDPNDPIPTFTLFPGVQIDADPLAAWGGHATYTSATPFTSIALVGIFGDPTVGTPPEAVFFAIDNVTVPTPGAAAALGLAGAASLRRRRR